MGMKQLKNFNKLNSILPRGTKVYYFDYPVYENVGDMLIWQGTEKFFKKNGVIVLKRFSYHLVNYELEKGRLIHIPKNVVIVCQGGGNFGDLYVPHQKLRNLLVKKYPEHRIVILPQTIFYKNEDKLQDDFSQFKKHKDLHLFVRDNKSYSLASEFLNNVYLSQDMAHTLYPIDVKADSNLQTLFFIRNDKERQGKIWGVNSPELDWFSIYNQLDRLLIQIFIKAHKSNNFKKVFPVFFLAKLWFIYTKYIINKAIRLFSKYELIVTSRLHGHILACLMNKENFLVDNSYGKNYLYHEAWTNSVYFAKKYSEQNKERCDQIEKFIE